MPPGLCLVQRFQPCLDGGAPAFQEGWQGQALTHGFARLVHVEAGAVGRHFEEAGPIGANLAPAKDIETGSIDEKNGAQAVEIVENKETKV